MIHQTSMTWGGDNLGTRSDNSVSDAASFWGGALSTRISHLDTPPSPEQYSSLSVTAASIEALEEKERVLQGVIDPILSHYYNEEQALESILEEFRKCRRRQECVASSSLAAIRHCRNRFIPVARLPPEILSRIFVFNARAMQPEDQIDAVRTISHVCKRWWEIALDCPKLWSHINLGHNPRWLETIIERSRSVPLSLLGDGGVERVKETAALVVNEMHRFKSIDLYITGGEERDTHFMFEKFSQSTPMLQHLTFTSYHHHLTYAFPHDFLGGCAPNLRHIKLDIESIYIPWNSGIFTNLITLEIDGVWTEDSEVDTDLSSLEMLLDALTEMPRLELLTLNHCIPPARSMAERIHVNLPNLERLELAGFLNGCADFLRQITIDASTTLILDLECSRLVSEDVCRFLDVLPSLSMTPAPNEALNFTSGSHNFSISAWSVQQGLGVKDTKNARISLNFYWDVDHDMYHPDIIWDCLSAFASPQLQSFRMSGDPVGWDVDYWKDLAGVAPNLQRLAVGGVTQPLKLCKALCPPDEPDTVLADCQLRALSYLELEARHNYTMSTLGGGRAQLSAVLARSLAARAAVGCLTPELVFIVPPSEELPEGWSGPLRKAVPGIIMRESHGFDKGMIPAWRAIL